MGNKFKISSFSIIVIFVFFTIVGLAFIPRLTVKLAPSQDLPQIGVSFGMSGASPVVVEMEATSKLESMLSRIKGVRKISSTSSSGGGRISIAFDNHTDIDAARFEVSAVIRQTWPQLPKEVSYPSISVSRSDKESARPFLNYTIISSQLPILIQQYADDHIKTQLSQIEGIYQINIRGANSMEWELEYDAHNLQILGLSTSDITSAINLQLRKEFLGLGSVVSATGKKEWIRLAIAADDIEDKNRKLEMVEIKNLDGRIIYLKDIARISHVQSETSNYYRINGKNTIYMSLYADDAANQLNLAKKVKTKLSELEQNFPSGYEVQLTYDATEYIQEELNKIYFRTGLTLLILILFILLVYRNLKYTLLVVLSLFFNICIAVIFYYTFRLEMQLYSLAGLTISLTLVIDNTIVMSDQIINRKNKKAFLAILTATVTTIAALSIIFFLDEKTRLNLKDFAAVVIINLTISLFTALFLIPAVIEKLNIKNKPAKLLGGFFGKKRKHEKRRAGMERINLGFLQLYSGFIKFSWRKRYFFIIAIVLLFGLPVFLLPDNMKGNDKFTEIYNKTIGSENYRENIKEYVETALGGTWRLFVQKVYEGSYIVDRGEETSLFVTATLPNGATVAHMNNLIQKMEAYIARYHEIKQFETNISGANSASINIRFHKEYQHNDFPHLLKSNIISKALQLGGGSWNVQGVGDGFNNDVKEQAGSYRIEMYGYNYNELLHQAEEFKNRLLEQKRIKDVSINSEFSWYKTDYEEFKFEVRKDKLAEEGIQPAQLFSVLKPIFEKRVNAGQFMDESGNEQIVMGSRNAKIYNIWDLNHIPLILNEKEFKLSDLAYIEKLQSPKRIAKENQQYRLCLQYEYIGAHDQGQRMLERNLEEFQEILPMGYTIQQSNRGGSRKEESSQYWLLLIVFVIIFFCSSILFNSLKQPFNIIFIIPVSYIGIFLTFYWFELNFDQGGFAAFILLSGLTVNSNIYIINEYNNIRKKRVISPLNAYIRAWNAKVRPILLTILSTILGFLPFMIGDKEGFWFPLAAGTIGGLIVSFLATFCFLPLFMGVGKSGKKTY